MNNSVGQLIPTYCGVEEGGRQAFKQGQVQNPPLPVEGRQILSDLPQNRGHGQGNGQGRRVDVFWGRGQGRAILQPQNFDLNQTAWQLDLNHEPDSDE